MLDLILIRPTEGGNPEIVYESQKKRYKSTEIIDKCIDLDKEWKTSKHLLTLSKIQW
jgi:seryl-tRNA synthetase